MKDIDLSKYKKSKKLFVIGSGISLNNITPQQWEEINQNDTFGFNFSFINNDHIPTFYATEAMTKTSSNKNGRSDIAETFFQLYETKKELYRNVIKLVDIPSGNLEHFENYGVGVYDEKMFVLNTVNGIGSDEEKFHQLINFLKNKKVFDKKSHLDELFKFRATLCMAICFGVNLGYEEVILCGIDLNDRRYYYQDKHIYPDLHYFRSSSETPVHATLMDDPLFLSIDKVIKILENEVCKEKGLKLFVQNPNSALASFLPIYKFRNQ